jgi:hypothetical protein
MKGAESFVNEAIGDLIKLFLSHVELAAFFGS